MSEFTKESKGHFVVTGLFGDSRTFGVYQAPTLSGVECLFFSNNDLIGEFATAKGWTFVKTRHPLIDDDYLETSLQSKWIKYLQFLNDGSLFERQLETPSSVIYFDHKFNVTSEHVAQILERDTTASILLRKTPVSKNSVWTEIEVASRYERYARNMEQTKSFVQAHIEQGASADVTICNTGLIHYRNLDVGRDLANRVYNTCQSLKQPECQVVWSMHAQAFSEKIEIIEWNDPLVQDIEWQDPKVYNSNLVTESEQRQRQPGHGIMVAGFHRSGTSSVAGLLHKAGVSAGFDLMEGTQDNSKGYFESWGLVKLHDRLMSSKGVDWAVSLEQKALLTADDMSDLRDYFDQRAEGADGAWCMKDPRIGRYIFEWKRAAPEIKTLLLYRSPNASALSLLRRSVREFAQSRGTLELPKRFFDDPDFALRLWVEHNEEYVRFCLAHPDDCIVVNHAAIMNGFDALQAVSDAFGIDFPRSSSSDFLDTSLLSDPRPIYVTSSEIRDRALAVWAKLTELDTAAQFQGDGPHSVEDRLILDEYGKLARGELLEMFAKAALREMGAQHEVAKEAFWVTNRQSDEIDRLTAEVARLEASEEHARLEAGEKIARLEANEEIVRRETSEKIAMLEARERELVLKRFNEKRPNRLVQMFKFRRSYAALRQSSLFDETWYLEQNTDVKGAGVDALKHYIRFGAAEGRDPSPSFATIRYLSINQDVLEAGVNPLLHYEMHGRKEGRSL